jgi:regulator of protease activity HflC (stomatin/prohibitin superfamily)
MELDDLLSEREKINEKLQTILDQQTDPWGIKVSNVELKHVDISEELRRAMARQPRLSVSAGPR